MFKIDCADLGIEDCDFHIEGETPADVIEQVREHLHKHNDLDLPKTDDILDGEYQLDNIDEAAQLVIRRLRQTLNVTPAEAPIPPRIIPPVVPNAGGTTPGTPSNY